ncbi:hypothetical protein MMPV_005776 [Pyropia vietnamensis]
MSGTPVERWRAPNDGATGATADAVSRPRAQQTARSSVEDPPLVVDRGEYGGGWGAPQSQVTERQEVVIVDMGAPPINENKAVIYNLGFLSSKLSDKDLDYPDSLYRTMQLTTLGTVSSRVSSHHSRLTAILVKDLTRPHFALYAEYNSVLVLGARPHLHHVPGA